MKRRPLSGKSASYVSPSNGLNGLQVLPSVEAYPDTANAATFRILIRPLPYMFLPRTLKKSWKDINWLQQRHHRVVQNNKSNQ